MSDLSADSADTASRTLVVMGASTGGVEIPLAKTAFERGEPSAGRPGTLMRAITFIDAQAGLGIGIDDIARAAGVSPRALQLTFRRHLGMTPTAYARRVRIAHAHRELQQAAVGDGTTVTRVALDWGFANASRFARYYRSLYGTRPGETLRDPAAPAQNGRRAPSTIASRPRS